MKRYLVFAGQKYYSGDGMKDFKNDFDSLEDATKEAMKEVGEYVWSHIYDCQVRKIIWECLYGDIFYETESNLQATNPAE